MGPPGELRSCRLHVREGMKVFSGDGLILWTAMHKSRCLGRAVAALILPRTPLVYLCSLLLFHQEERQHKTCWLLMLNFPASKTISPNTPVMV